MDEFKSLDEILDFAIKEEEAAAAFYKNLAGKMDRAWMKEAFEQFAREEEGHKVKLIAVKSGEKMLAAKEKVLDLKLADYLVEPDKDADIDYQKALILAMKKEKSAFKLYSDLAAKADDESVKETFLALAQEEAKHKLRFEVEYDEQYLSEN